MSTAVPVPTFGPTGFVAPLESDILAGRKADLNAAFVTTLNPQLDTPQGQIASSDTAIIGNCDDQFLALANGVDPAYAAGRMQDAIGRIYYLERIPARATAVTARCRGLVGTSIPAGSRAVDDNQVIYTAVAGGSIDSTGYVDLEFDCSVVGPIACPQGFINRIYQAIPGWDSFNNAETAAGVPGYLVETRSDFEYRRKISVAINGNGGLDSILGNVLAINGVLDAYATENKTGNPILTGGVFLVPHSIYVCVYGGDPVLSPPAIGLALWTYKSQGCDYNGTQTVIVQDPALWYLPPKPQYTVNYQIASPVPVLMSILMQRNPAVPAGAIALVKAAVLASFNGTDGSQRARIGGTLFATRFCPGIVRLGDWADIYSVTLGIPPAAFVGSITGTILTVTSVSSGILALGMVVTGDNIATGTTITGYITGTKDVGDYQVSINQTVISENMTGILIGQNTLSMNIDQIPTLSSSSISVVFT